jgi:hypothetical protein
LLDRLGHLAGHPVGVEPGHLPPDVYDVGDQRAQPKRHADGSPDLKNEHDRREDDHPVRDIDHQIDSGRIHSFCTPVGLFVMVIHARSYSTRE